MTTLHLGVVDVGYTDDQGATTTGDVAQYLEDRYHIMRSFVELNEHFIARQLVDQVAGAIESIAQGNRLPQLNWKPSMAKVEERFRDFIAAGELQAMLPASQQVSEDTLKTSSRTKTQKIQKPRQAFVDTGLFVASFRCWVT